MIFSGLSQRVQALAVEHAGTVLTGVGVAGTISTAVLTGRASFKAAHIIHKEALQRTPGDAESVGNDFVGLPDLPLSEKAKLVWPQFIPPVGMGALTITSIIYANRITTKRAAAMAAAYGLSEKTLEEYKEKVAEKFGVKKETEIRDSIAQERVTANPPDTRDVVIAGTGEVLCFDELSGRYFLSSMETLRKAENSCNFEIANSNSASLNLFYEEIGLPATAFSNQVGWDLDNKCDMEVSTTMTPDDKPCLVVGFRGLPKPEYGKIF